MRIELGIITVGKLEVFLAWLKDCPITSYMITLEIAKIVNNEEA